MEGGVCLLGGWERERERRESFSGVGKVCGGGEREKRRGSFHFPIPNSCLLFGDFPIWSGISLFGFRGFPYLPQSKGGFNMTPQMNTLVSLFA